MTGTDSIYSTEIYKAFPIGKKFQFRERGTSTDYQIKSYYGYHINIQRLSDNERATIPINELIAKVRIGAIYDEDGTQLILKSNGSISKYEDSEQEK